LLYDFGIIDFDGRFLFIVEDFFKNLSETVVTKM